MIRPLNGHKSHGTETPAASLLYLVSMHVAQWQPDKGNTRPRAGVRQYPRMRPVGCLFVRSSRTTFLCRPLLHSRTMHNSDKIFAVSWPKIHELTSMLCHSLSNFCSSPAPCPSAPLEPAHSLNGHVDVPVLLPTSLERPSGLRLPNILIRYTATRIVQRSLGVLSVDDTDEPFVTWLAQTAVHATVSETWRGRRTSHRITYSVSSGDISRFLLPFSMVTKGSPDTSSSNTRSMERSVGGPMSWIRRRIVSLIRNHTGAPVSQEPNIEDIIRAEDLAAASLNIDVNWWPYEQWGVGKATRHSPLLGPKFVALTPSMCEVCAQTTNLAWRPLSSLGWPTILHGVRAKWSSRRFRLSSAA